MRDGGVAGVAPAEGAAEDPAGRGAPEEAGARGRLPPFNRVPTLRGAAFILASPSSDFQGFPD